MTPNNASELVLRYGMLTKQIKDCTRKIGESLDLCQGINGTRIPKQTPFGFYREDHPDHFDSKNRDKRTHLWNWYQPDWQGGYGEEPVYEEIGEWSAEECPHCYAAHLAIQDRKTARKSLGNVKAAMSRTAND